MAGIFYLPRLFVYHAMSEDEVSKERFKIMKRKLYKDVMTPSMIPNRNKLRSVYFPTLMQH